MKFNLLTVGIGGEGVLTTGVVIARAAHAEKNYVMGLQLHGLAQRGGTIPVFVRFGDVHSPTFERGAADLIIATEPAEALRYAKYGSASKTIFIIDDNPVKSPYANIKNEHYPTKDEIISSLKMFAKNVYYVDISSKCEEKFGNKIYGNVALVGVAYGLGILPLKPDSIREAIKSSIKHDVDKNLAAFDFGVEYGKKLK